MKGYLDTELGVQALVTDRHAREYRFDARRELLPLLRRGVYKSSPVLESQRDMQFMATEWLLTAHKWVRQSRASHRRRR